MLMATGCKLKGKWGVPPPTTTITTTTTYTHIQHKIYLCVVYKTCIPEKAIKILQMGTLIIQTLIIQTALNYLKNWVTSAFVHLIHCCIGNKWLLLLIFRMQKSKMHFKGNKLRKIFGTSKRINAKITRHLAEYLSFKLHVGFELFFFSSHLCNKISFSNKIWLTVKITSGWFCCCSRVNTTHFNLQEQDQGRSFVEIHCIFFTGERVGSTSKSGDASRSVLWKQHSWMWTHNTEVFKRRWSEKAEEKYQVGTFSLQRCGKNSRQCEDQITQTQVELRQMTPQKVVFNLHSLLSDSVAVGLKKLPLFYGVL